MNAERRKELAAIREEIAGFEQRIAVPVNLINEAQGLQQGEQGQKMEESIGTLESAVESFDEAFGFCEQAEEELSEVTGTLSGISEQLIELEGN